MKRARESDSSDSEDDSSAEEVYNPKKRQKLTTLRDELGKKDRDLFDKLNEINNSHHLWTYFRRDQQVNFGTALNSIGADTFEDLKNTYTSAVGEYAEANKIAKVNNANVLNTYVPSGTQTDSLVIMFMNIGSGDCIFIQTPKGKTIVIDCGQRSSPQNRKSYRQEIRDALTGPTFLGGKKKSLYALILTHPDQDHYNEVTEIVGKCVSSVVHTFYTLNKGDYSINKTNKYLDKAKFLNRVTINSSGANLVTSEKGGWNKLYKADAKKKKIQILGKDTKLKLWDEDNCSIYLLAAETPNGHNKCHDTKQNAASIVTLIEAYGRKVLLCGDATLSTEAFLLTEHGDLIKDMDLMQLEHHGSGTEHAGDDFVKKINAVLAAASSGPHQSDRNPRWNTIEKYVNPKVIKVKPAAHRLRQDMDAHKLKYSDGVNWTNMNNNVWTKKYSTYGLFTTESNNDLCFIIDKNGNLIREFSDTKNTYTYKIAPTGVVTSTETKIKKKKGSTT